MTRLAETGFDQHARHLFRRVELADSRFQVTFGPALFAKPLADEGHPVIQMDLVSPARERRVGPAEIHMQDFAAFPKDPKILTENTFEATA